MEDGDGSVRVLFRLDVRTKIVIFDVDVFSLWSHFGGKGKLKARCIVFKNSALDNGSSDVGHDIALS